MTDVQDLIEEEGAARPAVNGRTLTNGQVMGFIWRQWMRRPGLFAVIIALMLVATFCDISIPWAAGGLIDAVSKPERLAPAAWRAWILLSGLYALYYVCRQSAFRSMTSFAARNMEALTNEAFARVQLFSADWHGDTFAGATVRRISRAMWGYDNVSDALILMLGPTLMVLGGLTVSMALRWPWAGLFCVVMVVGFIAFNLITAVRYIRPVNLRSNALDSKIGAALADAIGGNAAIKSFGAEGRESARFADATSAWRQAVIKTWNRFNTVGIVQNLIMLALQGGLTGILVFAWSKGQARSGDVAFAITSFMLMSGYMRNFGEITRMMQRGLDDTMDVAAYMKTEPQVSDRADAVSLTAGPAGTTGRIAFDQVSFRYKGQAAPIYDRFDLTIASGERLALVGPTGAGKSTFVKLIQRLYDLDGGRILINDLDIAGVTQASLRRAIAVVPQDPSLFHRTIGENIAYARPDAPHEAVVAAAVCARAHDFIMRLPKGYETLVGERGVKLSGGERQRVAIARAFLADAPILILDEATSSLDVETEQQVARAIEALMEGRTTIIIAHRLSTIRGADRILVFQDGRIVEEGRHSELVQTSGAYARLSALANS